MELENILKKAKQASVEMSSLSSDLKNEVLVAISKAIMDSSSLLLSANKKDLDEAKKLLESNEISQSVFNRLKLDENKIDSLCKGILDLAKLEDPVNKTIFERELSEELNLYKVSTPIGVIAVIFEARPDVIAQVSSLMIKSSNAVILKGGKEAFNTNKAFFELITNTISRYSEFPSNSVNIINSREDVANLLNMDKYIDLIIPRGGNSLVKFIKQNTKIPVLGHADGVCHIFIDKEASFEKAVKISLDAKLQYPSACNSVETILIDKNLNEEFIKNFCTKLEESGIEIRVCEKIQKILPQITLCEDWDVEYSDKILGIKMVDDVSMAINHINTYGSGHTDCIITENKAIAEVFMNLVDSAGVYHNTSTRFADGFRYGFGAEVGISTNKTHARGPVGLEGLTIYKYKLYGNGHIVSEFVDGTKTFTHKEIKKG